MKNNFFLIKRAFDVFFFKDRKKVLIIVFSQCFLGLIDLLAIAVIGLLASLAITGIQSVKSGNFQYKILELIKIRDFSFQSQVAILGAIAVTLLVSRTIFSIIVVKRNLKYLVEKTINISTLIVDHLLRKDYLDLNKNTIQENTYLVTDSVRNVSIGIIGTIITMSSDFVLTFILIFGLLFADPVMTIFIVATMSLIVIAMTKKMQERALKLGNEYRLLTTTLRGKIAEAIRTYREIVVRNRRDFYISNINNLQVDMAKNGLETAFLPYVSKYVIETFVVISAIFIAGYQFTVGSATHAISTLSMFLAASTRITPALLRMQQAFTILKLNIGTSADTLDLISKIGGRNQKDLFVKNKHKNYERHKLNMEEKRTASMAVEFENVSFAYPETNKAIFENFSFHIDEGSLIGVVGPSGAGKTTLVDLMLGILLPTRGFIKIGGLNPREAIERYAGAISYVTQEFQIINGTLKENITIGYPEIEFTDEHLYRVLQMVSLSDYVNSLPLGLDTQIRDMGTNLSGGQKQRINLARALINFPKLLVLDEATSALDSKVELEITSTIKNLRKSMTIVVIAHRLATLRDFDQIIYVDNKIDFGTFDELRKKNKKFNQQAIILGL